MASTVTSPGHVNAEQLGERSSYYRLKLGSSAGCGNAPTNSVTDLRSLSDQSDQQEDSVPLHSTAKAGQGVASLLEDILLITSFARCAAWNNVQHKLVNQKPSRSGSAAISMLSPTIPNHRLGSGDFLARNKETIYPKDVLIALAPFWAVTNAFLLLFPLSKGVFTKCSVEAESHEKKHRLLALQFLLSKELINSASMNMNEDILRHMTYSQTLHTKHSFNYSLYSRLKKTLKIQLKTSLFLATFFSLTLHTDLLHLKFESLIQREPKKIKPSASQSNLAVQSTTNAESTFCDILTENNEQEMIVQYDLLPGAILYATLKANPFPALIQDNCSSRAASWHKKPRSFFVLLFLLVSLLAQLPGTHATMNMDSMKSSFEKNYGTICCKYAFVQKYENMIQQPPNKYFIFVYHNRHVKNGGLGDRLAGLITAFFYALRTNRTLLIEGDIALQKAFQPYFKSSSHLSKVTWEDWKWAGWQDSFANEMVKLHCVNPSSDQRHCALEDSHQKKWENSKVIRYFGNRVYLCRWLFSQDVVLQSELRELWRILSPTENESKHHDNTINTNSTNTTISTNSSRGGGSEGAWQKNDVNLYEIAGCALRSLLHPTDVLWNTSMELIKPALLKEDRKQVQEAVPPLRLVSTHFRCGDSSFSSNQINPQCVFSTSAKWLGTSFVNYDRTMDSPVDLAHCAKQFLPSNNSLPSHKMALLYVTSDSPLSSQQVVEKADYGLTVQPSQRCHVDLHRDASTLHVCATQTFSQWFLLGLSDFLITQGRLKQIDSKNGYEDQPNHIFLVNQLTGYDEYVRAPISAFSRYASIYSLKTKGLRYGLGCHEIDVKKVAMRTHGNWVCNPNVFF
eukprot:scaffold3779_cov254-Ochromonas_danica.AAC.27